MHELSIATSLVRLAEQSAREAGAARVTRVHLRLGVLSGVVREALDFAYDIATEGTMLTGSELVVEDVPLVVWCSACESERSLSTITRFRCPTCDAPTPDVRSGRELEISHLDVEGEIAPEPAGDGAAAGALPQPPWSPFRSVPPS
ncbi:MAG: hydrogenase maturation nickel metallochaperone HypA [Bacteroidota bacterium]